MNLKHAPLTRIGWHQHYASRFNKSGGEQAAHLANWYQLLHLAFDAPQVFLRETKPHSRAYTHENITHTR